MKILFRTVAAILFIIFFGFAAKNSQEVDLHLFLGYEIRGPLILLLLSFFAAGASLGILAMTPTLLRYRRDVVRHQKAMATVDESGTARQHASMQALQPDGVVTK